MKYRFTKKVGLVLALLTATLPTLAQTGSLGIGTTAPDPKAALEIAASDKGLLIPRLDSAQRAQIVAPPQGLLVYQKDGRAGLWYYQNGWQFLKAGNQADNLGNHTATRPLTMNGQPINFGAALTQQLNLWNNDYALGVQPYTLMMRSSSAFVWYKGGTYSTTQHDPGLGGSTQMQLTDEGHLGVGIGSASPQHRLHVGGRLMLDGGVIQRGGAPITGTSDLGLYSRTSGQWLRFVTNGAATRFYSDDNSGTTPNFSIESNGYVAVGPQSAANRFEVQHGGRSGTHATGRAFYVTGDFGAADAGAEFRHSNGTQGIGLGFNSLYAAGTNPDQHLNLLPKGTGGVGIGTTAPRGRLDVVGGDSYFVTDPNNGSSQSVYLPGHLFLAPHSGASGTAYVQARVPNPTSGTSVGLAFRTTSSGSIVEALHLSSNGNVGIGTNAPSQKLEVVGQIYSSGGIRVPDNTVQTTAATTSAPQTLSLSGQSLSISGGNSVTLPATADNLGNHTATQNLNLGTSQLVGNGGASGVAISSGGSVGIGTTSPNVKAALDVTSTSKGVLLPRLTTAQRDAIAPSATEQGLVIFNSETNTLNLWNGLSWSNYLFDAPATPARTFSYTGGPQTYTVPAGITRLSVEVAGAAGGGQFPGLGGRLTGVLAVTPGQVLTITVGGAGSVTSGGYNGGGNGATSSSPVGSSGGGGGASDVRLGGTALANRILVAGGGGGMGLSSTFIGGGTMTYSSPGGCGGGTSACAGSGSGPNGGTQSGPTTSGTGTSGYSSTFGPGSGSAGGGGGGGYFGGGGGGFNYGGPAYTLSGGGGGGSSYAEATLITNIVHTQGTQAGNGYVKLTPLGQAPVLDATNFVNVPTDNLGNHTATQNLNLGTSQLVGNGGTSGLAVSNVGNVGVGLTGATNRIDVAGAGRSGTHATGRPLYVTGELGAADNGVEFRHSNGSQGIGIGHNSFYAAGTNVNQDLNLLPKGTGRVGIGTTAPGALLDVNGSQLVRGALGFGASVRQMLNLYNGDYGIGVQGGTQYFRSGDAFAWYAGGTHNDNQFNGGGGTMQMVLKNSRLGIGTATNPVAPLEIQRDNASAYLTMHEAYGAWFSFGMDYNDGNKIKISDGPDFSGANYLTIAGGKLGVGTTAPAAKLDVQGSGAIGSYNFAYYAYTGSTPFTGTANNANSDVSIRASGRIVGTEFNATSDRRLKSIIGLSDNAVDLALLTRLRITDYTMRDRAQYGDRTFKKVIAQEVEEVFPQAVSRHRGFLPDIYTVANAAEAAGDSLLRLTLPKAVTGAQTGQRVKLVGRSGEVVGTLAQPASGNILLVRGARELAGDQVFVFGLEHPDVRTVDYEALSMLNVSATQELVRQLTTLQAQNTRLEQRATTAEAAIQSFEQRLREVESRFGTATR